MRAVAAIAGLLVAATVHGATVDLAAEARRTKQARKRANVRKKVFAKFEQYLKSRLDIDEREGHIVSEKHRRLTRLRNEYVKHYRNVTKLPDSMSRWYKELVRNLQMRSCGTRSIGECTTFIPFDAIWSYGCWCYFGENAGDGQGPPQNSIDEACRALSLCYKCSTIDSYDTASLCRPGFTDYQVGITKAFQQGSYVACTNEFNDNECQVNVCTCETQFIRNLLDLFFQGYKFDPSLHHNNWSDAVCKIKGEGPSTLECCGQYPNRVPFKMESSTECCQNMKLYNSDSQSCCADGNVRAVC